MLICTIFKKGKTNLYHLILSVPVLLFLILFFPVSPSASDIIEEEVDVVSIAQTHKLKKIKIQKEEKDGKKTKRLICFCDGKRLKKKEYWFYADGAVYYLNKRGYVHTGTLKYQGNSYRFSKKGKLYINRLYEDGNITLYYGRTGALATNEWITVKGARHYFLGNGQMAVNQWVENLFVDYRGNIIAGTERQWNSLDSTSDPEKWVLLTSQSNSKKLIIIGASRVQQMHECVSAKPDVTFMAEGGEGLDWFKKQVLPSLDVMLKAYPDSIVVLQLGNNDVKRSMSDRKLKSVCRKYVKTYRQLIKKYSKTAFYIMDVLPSGNGEPKKKNQKRETFNHAIAKAFPKQSIGGYDYLTKKGFTTTDGIHYDSKTYRKLYSYILKKVNYK